MPRTASVSPGWSLAIFASGPVVEAWTRWCRAGANHHSAATPGDFAGPVESVARFLGVEAVRV